MTIVKHRPYSRLVHYRYPPYQRWLNFRGRNHHPIDFEVLWGRT